MNAPVQIPVSEIEDVFFRAMVERSWASGADHLNTGTKPRFKQIPWHHGPWLVIDEWCVGPNGLLSAGSVTIFFRNWPVWVMSFHGRYEAEAIPFLRQALMEAYEQRRFEFGRARPGYVTGPMIYTHKRHEGDFSQFSCQERVVNVDRDLDLGFHIVQGMLLI